MHLTRRRNGMALAEVAAATILLAALGAFVAETVAWSAAEQRATQRREIALSEAANAMERTSIAGWAALEPKPSTEMALSPLAKRMLPGGRIIREVTDADGEPAARRIVIEVSWLNQAGERERPVRLTTWVYR